MRTRNGDLMIIPNSVLNTAALTKLTPVSEGMSTLEFTAKASSDPAAVSQDILDRVTKRPPMCLWKDSRLWSNSPASRLMA